MDQAKGEEKQEQLPCEQLLKRFEISRAFRTEKSAGNFKTL